MTKPSAAQLRELVHYDPDTGLFTRRRGVQGYGVGTSVGSLTAAGYVYCKVAGYRCYAHRLAWCYVYGDWPTLELDHINGERADNRIANLRQVSHSENMLNKLRPMRGNKSGYLGVVAHNSGWRADLTIGGVQHYLGVFDSPEAASAAYVAAKEDRTRQTECLAYRV